MNPLSFCCLLREELWKSAATGAWQCDMGLTANPKTQVLYCIDPKASYMTVKSYRLTTYVVGLQEVHPTPDVLRSIITAQTRTFLGYKGTRIAAESQLCCKLTLGFGQCLLATVLGLSFFTYQMEGTDTKQGLVRCGPFRDAKESEHSENKLGSYDRCIYYPSLTSLLLLLIINLISLWSWERAGGYMLKRSQGN